MNFKEYIANDVSKTIINTDEFGSDVVINGVSVKVVEDSDELEYRIKKNYDGLIIGDVLFFISESEYQKIPNVLEKPSANQSIRYDGKPSVIINVSKSEGMYEIIIQHTGGR